MLFSGSTARLRSSTGYVGFFEPEPRGADVDQPAALRCDAYLITVEADVAQGLPSSFWHRRASARGVKEGRERIVAALQKSGFQILPRRVT
ncbi:MAG TPA: hypothetical protein VFE05_17515 [Longimicrobiaceae bacterium]|jgi:hypothetical protein|nr:hypothetical protein [Longimicrobiaceae bacterium]